MKSTVIAPSNIAFIKYWGKKDKLLRLPENDSISMNLSGLTTITTVEFADSYKKDEVSIDNVWIDSDSISYKRIIGHIDRIRAIGKTKLKAKVVSENSFPHSTGLSSSASGFAALTLAATTALGLQLSEKKLTQIARLASGSACRSIPSGFVQWFAGDSDELSYAATLYPPGYWDLIDMVVIISHKTKHISTSKAQEYVNTSPFFRKRIENIDGKIKKLKKAMQKKNFSTFGEIVEQEALELHAIMMTSKPALIYILPETLHLMRLVNKWRQNGLPVYFTLNTGQNIHLICEKKHKDKLIKLLKEIQSVIKVIENKPCNGARQYSNNLF